MYVFRLWERATVARKNPYKRPELWSGFEPKTFLQPLYHHAAKMPQGLCFFCTRKQFQWKMALFWISVTSFTRGPHEKLELLWRPTLISWTQFCSLLISCLYKVLLIRGYVTFRQWKCEMHSKNANVLSQFNQNSIKHLCGCFWKI